jgi:hypothetical protein
MTLGDRWGAETPPVETSPVTVEYWRQKALEFQTTLNAVDSVAQESWALASVLPEGSQLDSVMEGLQEFESMKRRMKTAGEAINALAAIVNTAGGRFPVLSIPSALGLPPVAIPAGIALTLAGLGGVIAGATAWAALQARRIESSIDAVNLIADPEERANAAREVALIRARAEAAAATADSPLASLANVAKWAGIAALAFFAFRAFQGMRGSASAD